jgi:hypothetical protein
MVPYPVKLLFENEVEERNEMKKPRVYIYRTLVIIIYEYEFTG